MQATSTFNAKRRAEGSVARPVTVAAKRCRYSHMTASMAPVWMAISKTLTVSPVKSSKEPARIR